MEKQWKQYQTLFLGGSKITVDGDCSHEIKRRLLLGRKWKQSLSVMSDCLWPMDCSPPSSSVHGILQARILEWADISFSIGRKVMTNLDSIWKSRDITLPTKVHLVKAMVFLEVMYGCESWTVKKAEHRRIDAFELWCWRRLLRVPLDCKEIHPTSPFWRISALGFLWKEWC